jgi:hypothetical protein
VLCFLGEADGKYSGDFAKWKQAGEFYATLARWIAGKHRSLPDEMLLTQKIRDGMCFVQLHLDPERKADPFSALPRALVLHEQPGAAPVKETMTMQWKNADLLEAAIPVAGGETVLNTIEIPGQQPVTLPPACLPYSPEFAPDQPGRGAMALEQIAATTGGGERIEIPKIWSELPVRSRYVALAPWLLVAGTILFLLEIFERRTGWLLRPWTRKTPAAATEEPAGLPAQTVPAAKPAFPWLVRKPSRRTTTPVPVWAKPPAPDSPTPAAPMPAPKESVGGLSAIEALRKARERARRRSENKDL